MAEHPQLGQQYGPQHGQQVHPTDAIKHMLPQKSPSTSQVLAVCTLFPVGGLLLILAGLTLAGTVIGLTLATPVFILFSPVIVPAALTIGVAVTGFLASGAFGITGLSSLSWIFNYIRQAINPEQARQKVQDKMGQVGQKTREVGQQIQSKAPGDQGQRK